MTFLAAPNITSFAPNLWRAMLFPVKEKKVKSAWEDAGIGEILYHLAPKGVKKTQHELKQFLSFIGLAVATEPRGGGGVTSTHNKQGCAILTWKVEPKNPVTYVKLTPKILDPEH